MWLSLELGTFVYPVGLFIMNYRVLPPIRHVNIPPLLRSSLLICLCTLRHTKYEYLCLSSGRHPHVPPAVSNGKIWFFSCVSYKTFAKEAGASPRSDAFDEKNRWNAVRPRRSPFSPGLFVRCLLSPGGDDIMCLIQMGT